MILHEQVFLEQCLNINTGLSIVKKAYHDLHPQNKDIKLVPFL